MNLLSQFYKESDPFYHEGCYWKLFAQKFEDEPDVQISLKYSQDFRREYQTVDDQIFYDENSVLSILNWTMDPKEVKMSQMNISHKGCVVELKRVKPEKFFGPEDSASLSIDIYFTVKPLVSLLFNNLIINFSKIIRN